MSASAFDQLLTDINPGNVLSEAILDRLRGFSLLDREAISRRTGTLTVYFDHEVREVREAEEAAALRAMPHGHDIMALNGLNIGCGDRPVHPSLLCVDIARTALVDQGGHATASSNAMLALCDDLPFASDTIDFIIALHMLEHVVDPVGVLRHWLLKLKPGGGIGLVLPDWRYTWDAGTDASCFGHKWNSEPELLKLLWEQHLQDLCSLEALQTYPYKLSFDLVLRKHGQFKPFALPQGTQVETGASRLQRGTLLALSSPQLRP